MEIQKQAERLQAMLAGDPDIGEMHLLFHVRWTDCVATVELFWSADEPDRRYMAIDFDMKRDWSLRE
ncbi:hypothetical protein [Marinobacter sp.]|uniref:hypothetical protein n=1 Tax=Marinobacter sp. TaxID=50741 RepID=UPI002B265A0E|nr:hypothetical protein [Marinobacter sp.]